jgi:hypothetical protein
MVFRLPYKMKKPLDRLNRRGDIFITFPDKEILQSYGDFLREETDRLRAEEN